MKKIIFFAVLSLFMVTACHLDPQADFTANTNLVEPYEYVYFTNYSSDADDYVWDFGDGYRSSEESPSHYYSSEGTYTVLLTASRHNGGSDEASITIEVYYTSLEVTVAEWNIDYVLDNMIADAEVTLYESYDDWYNLNNPVETRITDSDGLAVFPDVEPVVYFIDVYHPYYNNEALGYEDIDFIRTLELEYTYINTFTAWVDYLEPLLPLKSSRIRTPYIIKAEKRSYKTSQSVKSSKTSK